MTTKLTQESRHAISRAKFFLGKAKGCSADYRVDFEAFLEAAIVFARAAVHRLKAKYKSHPQWKVWWDSLRDDPAVEFFRTERDWILKQASPKVNQKIFLPTLKVKIVSQVKTGQKKSVPTDGVDQTAYVPTAASEFYYYDDPETSATDTVEQHLASLEQRLAEIEQRFFSAGDQS